MTAAGPVPGRTIVTAKAQKRVLQALAADELGVAATAPSIDLTDDAGRLSAAVTSTAAPSSRAKTLMSLIESTRRRLAGEGARILGAEVSHVAVRITDITNSSRRVK